jgi:hypothetical protein
VPIPHDCTDGFLAAYWRRPDAYLDRTVRSNISAFALLGREEIDAGVARLSADLAPAAGGNSMAPFWGPTSWTSATGSCGSNYPAHAYDSGPDGAQSITVM